MYANVLGLVNFCEDYAMTSECDIPEYYYEYYYVAQYECLAAYQTTSAAHVDRASKGSS